MLGCGASESFAPPFDVEAVDDVCGRLIRLAVPASHIHVGGVAVVDNVGHAVDSRYSATQHLLSGWNIYDWQERQAIEHAVEQTDFVVHGVSSRKSCTLQ